MSTVFESQGSTQSLPKEASSESMDAVSAVEGGSTGGSSSVASTPTRKRAHPASLSMDGEAPPNKRLHTPTVRKHWELLAHSLFFCFDSVGVDLIWLRNKLTEAWLARYVHFTNSIELYPSWVREIYSQQGFFGGGIYIFINCGE